MSITDKAFEAIDEADLQTLVSQAIVEGKTIEYKRDLPSNAREGKKEFLADVTSFANASGGHIIYGIREESGTAVELLGIRLDDVDSELLRLDNLIRDCVDPRIPGVHLRAVPLQNGYVAIVVHVPRSWALPHAVNFDNHWRFYARNSAGKYQLDVSEVRAAFLQSDSAGQRLRNFRVERVASVEAGETPVQLPSSAKLILHLVPLAALDPSRQYDMSVVERSMFSQASPIPRGSFDFRHNFDGFVTYTRPTNTTRAVDYTQIYRNGSIEAVNTTLLDSRMLDGTPYIPSVSYEQALLEGLSKYLVVQQSIGVEPPILLMLSLTGVLGYIMAAGQRHFFRGETYPIDRNHLMIQEVIVENYAVIPEQTMRPLFDATWNAAGWPRSMSYDEAGGWKGHH